MITVLAILLLEPKDLPRIAQKSARAYMGLRGFMKTNWLALAEGGADEDSMQKPGAKAADGKRF